MPLKPCIACGTPTAAARCDDCQPSKPDHILSREERGYDHSWRALSLRARRLQPFCTDCRSTHDLTTDHTPEAWERKAAGLVIRLEDVDVLCRSCNSKAGPARGEGARPSAEPPTGQAGKALHTGGGDR